MCISISRIENYDNLLKICVNIETSVSDDSFIIYLNKIGNNYESYKIIRTEDFDKEVKNNDNNRIFPYKICNSINNNQLKEYYYKNHNDSILSSNINISNDKPINSHIKNHSKKKVSFDIDIISSQNSESNINEKNNILSSKIFNSEKIQELNDNFENNSCKKELFSSKNNSKNIYDKKIKYYFNGSQTERKKSFMDEDEALEYIKNVGCLFLQKNQNQNPTKINFRDRINYLKFKLSNINKPRTSVKRYIYTSNGRIPLSPLDNSLMDFAQIYKNRSDSLIHKVISPFNVK